MIAERTLEGLRALVLSGDDDGIEATFVPEAGMVGCSLRHLGEELLGQRKGLRAYASEGGTMGIPLLYPWANRLVRTGFPVAGGEVRLERAESRLELDPNGLPIHGLLAAARGWNVERHESRGDGGTLAATFDFAAHRDLAVAFPFPHELRYEATLAGPTLTVSTTVDASRDAPVPVSFGYHPYFRLPREDRSRWRIEIPASEQLVLDERMLPTGARTPVEIPAGPLGSRTFDDAYLAPAGPEPFVLAGGRRRIEVRFAAGYPYAQVYAPADDDVVAYEPMTAPTNALVADGPELTIVQPGGRYTATFSVTVTAA